MRDTMIADGEALDLIPARGGSNRVPRKNLRALAGKPLLQWSAQAGPAARYLGRAVLPTDHEEIAQVGASLGFDAPVRSATRAISDAENTAEAARHAIATAKEEFN